MGDNLKLKNFLLLLLLASFWGPSFLFIKIAIEYVPPITLANLRVGIAALFLFAILKIKKLSLPKIGKVWRHFIVIGLFNSAIPFYLFSFGETYITSSLAAILNGTTPLITIVIAHFFTENDRLSKVKFFGAIIGFGGLFLLVAPSLFNGSSKIIGIIAILMATTCYGINLVYSKKHMRGIKPIVTSTAQLFVATLFLLPFSFIIEKPYEIDYVSLNAILSILGLAIIGTGFAFMLFFKIIEETSATYASNVTYIIPIFGIILGFLILEERLTWNNYLGSLVIILGVMIANNMIKINHIIRFKKNCSSYFKK